MTDQFKPKRRSARRTNPIAASIFFLFIQPEPALADPLREGLPLQLEVSINGMPSGLIGAFTRLPDGRMTATAAELTELGLKTDIKSGDAGAMVVIDQLPGVRYDYDERQQTIDMSTGDQGRIAKSFDAQKSRPGSLKPESGFGSVLNYALFGSAGSAGADIADSARFDGASLTLDHRIYSPYGTFSNSGIAGTTAGRDSGLLRLDTVWSTTNDDLMVTASAGDNISGGFAWTKPIRIGGLQLRRNFDVRPDLITMPLPQVSGSAAVPSTVDVYVNNVKTFSQNVPSGPFSIQNIPVIAGNGDARIVVRDATGHETESVTPFSTSSDLLKPGLLDYSIEAGLPRNNYGSESFDYAGDPVAVASLRYGLTDWLTAETHLEASQELLSGGLGGVTVLGRLGTFNGALSGSAFDGRLGLQAYGSFETQISGVSLSLSTMRTIGDYSDLAYASALTGFQSRSEIRSHEPDRAVDRLSAGFALPEQWGGLGLGLVHIEDGKGKDSFYVSSNYTRHLVHNAALSISGYMQLGDEHGFGASLDLSAPLGAWGYGSASALTTAEGTIYSATAAKARGQQPGSLGWRAEVQGGGALSGRGQVNYRTTMADAEINAAADRNGSTASAFAEGALILADNGVFATRRVDDAFAIVDAGAPNVTVEYQNQAVGRTGKSGKLLVPGLHAYEANKIAIRAEDLALNADYRETEKTVVPKDRSGTLVKFAVKPEISAAIVVFRDADGQPVPPGTQGTLPASGERFIVGYDGQAYLKQLQPHNIAELSINNGICGAEFDYQRQEDGQAFVDGVVCK